MVLTETSVITTTMFRISTCCKWNIQRKTNICLCLEKTHIL